MVRRVQFIRMHKSSRLLEILASAGLLQQKCVQQNV
jgi:hypothetical protein